VSASVAELLLSNGTLDQAEIKEILRWSASPATGFRSRGPNLFGVYRAEAVHLVGEGKSFNFVDSADHSFKFGYGRADIELPRRMARDPISWAICATRPKRPTGLPRLDEASEMLLKRWDSIYEKHKSSYEGLAQAAVKVALRDSEFRESLLWLGRHVRVVAQAPVVAEWDKSANHRALVRRIRYALGLLKSRIADKEHKGSVDMLCKETDERLVAQLKDLIIAKESPSEGR
jgi:hypothetical protein